jgi:hypothetical protein
VSRSGLGAATAAACGHATMLAATIQTGRLIAFEDKTPRTPKVMRRLTTHPTNENDY